MQTDIKFRTGTAQGAADTHIQGQHAAVEQARPGTSQATVEQTRLL
jgi:hypothetical protein